MAMITVRRSDRNVVVRQAPSTISFGLLGPQGPAGPDSGLTITAQNPTTGQLQINGVEMGDTGARDIAGLLSAPWVAPVQSQSPRLRRVGNVVVIAGTVENTAALWDAPVLLLTLPFGFRPDAVNVWSQHIGTPPGGNDRSELVFANTGMGLMFPPEPSGVRRRVVSTSWTTNNAWPTTLPGVPAVEEISALPEVP